MFRFAWHIVQGRRIFGTSSGETLNFETPSDADIFLCLSNDVARDMIFSIPPFLKKITQLGVNSHNTLPRTLATIGGFFCSVETKPFFSPQPDVSQFCSALDHIAEFILSFFSKTWTIIPALHWAETISLQSQNGNALGLHLPLAVCLPGNIVGAQNNKHYSQWNGDFKMLDKESSLKRRFFSLKFLLLLHCKLDIPTLMMVIILLHKKNYTIGHFRGQKSWC